MPKRIDVQRAAHDLHLRTLSKISRPLDRLIYLASTRDYNTGLYYHDGLAARFSEEVACEALADCHREAFRELTSSSLKTWSLKWRRTWPHYTQAGASSLRHGESLNRTA